MISAGKHRARAQDGRFGESKNGKDEAIVAFQITSGEHKGEWINAYLYFATEKQETRSIESLRYAGWRGNKLTDLSDLSNGRTPEVELVIEHEEYNGKTSAKVKWVNALMQQKPPSHERVSSLEERLRARGLLGGAGGPPGNEPPPPDDADRGGPGDDDQPF